ncbi:hypothetical protein [Mycobacterium arosiense]|uniref:hypothetical protein n=1 Tax=Mycobacterium arosiense TaxID=425468 RepID=UPI001301E78A|nr:hypothetical protein [Mycobacterium arosiense]
MISVDRMLDRFIDRRLLGAAPKAGRTARWTRHKYSDTRSGTSSPDRSYGIR